MSSPAMRGRRGASCSDRAIGFKVGAMPWLEWANLVVYGVLGAGVLFLIWSLVRGSVSVVGLGLLILGLLLELVFWFIR